MGKMDDLPITLADGERWLPKDMFPVDDDDHHLSRPFASKGSSMDDRSRQFRNATSYPKHSLGEFGPRRKYGGVSGQTPNRYSPLTLGPTVDHGLHNFAHPAPRFPAPTNPALGYGMTQLVRPRVARQVMETGIARNRPVQRQQTRPFNNQFRANGSNKFGSSVTSSRGSTSGTGVFIPRTPLRTPLAKEKPSGITAERKSSKKKDIGRGEEYYHHQQHHKINSSEVCLPKDWTY